MTAEFYSCSFCLILSLIAVQVSYYILAKGPNLNFRLHPSVTLLFLYLTLLLLSK